MLRPLVNRLLTQKSLNNSTSLISLYVPATTNISDLSKMIKSETSQSQNIKSRQTRQGVQDALQGISTHIKSMKTIPNNGVAIFTGATTEGFTSIAIEPPRPIDRFFYRCDSKYWV